MNTKKWLFPVSAAALLAAGAVLRLKMLACLQHLATVNYEFKWTFLCWFLAFITEIAFGFILCLLITQGSPRIRRFSAVHFVLFLLLCGGFWAARFYLLYPVLPPDQTLTVILNTLAGAMLFQAFFRMEGRTSQTGWKK